MDGLAAHGHDTRASRSIASSPTSIRSGQRRRRPPQHRSDARQQLVVDDGPRQVVVGAALERADAVDRVRLLLDQARSPGRRGSRSCPARPRGGARRGRARSRGRGPDASALRARAPRRRTRSGARGSRHSPADARGTPRRGLRLGEQQRGCHALKLATSFGSRKMSFRTILRRSFPSRPSGLLCSRRPCSASPPDGRTTGGSVTPRCPSRVPKCPRAPPRREIVVAGGFVAGGGNSARVDAYSVKDDGWRRLPDLPVSVDHAAAASANGRVYVVGGYGGDRLPSERSSCSSAAPGARSHACPTGVRQLQRRSPAAGSMWSAVSTGAGSLARVAFVLTSARSAGRGSPARPHASTSPRPPHGGGSTRSAGARPGSTRTRRPSRSTTRRRSAGAGSHRCRKRAAARARRRSAGASSRSAARRRPARSERVRLQRAGAPLVAAPRPPHAASRPRRGGGERPDLGDRRRARAGAHRQRRGRVPAALEPAGAQHADEQPHA